MLKTFVGDIHGEFYRFNAMLERMNADHEVIQVGDYGIFREGDSTQVVHPHRFIRGNHDNPALCKAHPRNIPDGTVEGNVMYIGGAGSIDKHLRTEGVDWRRDEELSYAELDSLINKYEEVKPDVMVTHDMPEVIKQYICAYTGKIAFPENSRTRLAFDEMTIVHTPKLWIFGHWHVNFDMMVGGCRFLCLNIHDTATVDVDSATVLNIERTN